MYTSGLTLRYFPLPHPTSKPTEPGGRDWRNCSTIGHGCTISRRPISFHLNAQHFFDMIEGGRLSYSKSHLVTRRREMRGNLIVDFVDVKSFISFTILLQRLICNEGLHS